MGEYLYPSLIAYNQRSTQYPHTGVDSIDSWETYKEV